MTTDRSLLTKSGAMFYPKAFYFFLYGAMASLAPFLALYYDRLGFSGNQVGALASLPAITGFLSAPILAAIADATRRHRYLLLISILSAAIMMLVISSVNSFLLLIPAVILYAITFSSILPVVDNTVLEMLGENKEQYGKQRLWGAVGWGLFAPIAGSLVENWGLRLAFYSGFVLMLFVFLVATRLPVGEVSIGGSFRKGLKRLLSNREMLIFLFVIFLGGAGLSIVHNYLFLYLDSLGASSSLMGISLTIATVSELLVMYYSDRLIRWLGNRGLLTWSLVFLVLRLVGFAFAPNPYFALPIQLLHGPTFAALWMAGVGYAGKIAPPGLGTTAQGLFSGMVMGLGAATGGFLGGSLYQTLGFSRLFLGVAGGITIALFLFLLAENQFKRNANKTYSSP